MKRIINIFRDLIFFVKCNYLEFYSGISDEKVRGLFLQKVHFVDKKLNVEKKIDFILLCSTRRIFFEALKRGILSKDEIEWGERVLLGNPANPPTGCDDDKDMDGLVRIIKGRRSIRSWEPEEITGDMFEELVNSARFAPSSCNRQPIFFLLTNDREKIRLLSEVRKQGFVRNAPSCILVLVNTEIYDEKEIGYTPFLDAGAAIENLLLRAHSLGLGACWVNFGQREVPESKRDSVRIAFQIPDNYHLISIIPIGFPNQIPSTPGRKGIKDISSYEKFMSNKDDNTDIRL